MSESKARPLRDEFGYLCPVDSRWADNDVYGHINNVVYYSYFDSTINRYLIDHGGLDIHDGEVIAYVVSSGCDYFEAAAYPDALRVGLRVDKLGNSSVRYGLALLGRRAPPRRWGSWCTFSWTAPVAGLCRFRNLCERRWRR